MKTDHHSHISNDKYSLKYPVLSELTLTVRNAQENEQTPQPSEQDHELPQQILQPHTTKNKDAADCRNIKYSVQSHDGTFRTFELNILTLKSTIEYIRQHKCSIARFGDGEISYLLSMGAIRFQKRDAELCAALHDVIMKNDERCLVCLPGFLMQDWKGVKTFAVNFWQNFIVQTGCFLLPLLQKVNRTFWGDTQITRPYMDYISNETAKEIYPFLKGLWKNRNLLIVEGTATRMGVRNDLFADALSIQRILCPPENAFSRIDEIEHAVCDLWNEDLVLLALGPTATVLASRLSQKGIQALDVGHIDIEYEWFLRNVPDRIKIPGKYVNEVFGGNSVEDIRDKEYYCQIRKIIQ